MIGKYLKILLMNIFILLGAVLAIEGFLWALFPFGGSDVIRKYSQTLPGLKDAVVYKRLDLGLRALSMETLEKPNNIFRILCIGASTTDQPTQNIEDTWCAQIEMLLSKSESLPKNIQFQAVSYGVGGEKASDTAWYLHENLEKIDPDLVITLLGINDMIWNGGEQYDYMPGNLVKFFERESGSAKQFLRKYSQIRKRLRLIKQKYNISRGRSIEWHSRSLSNLRDQYQKLPYQETVDRNPDPIDEFSEAVNWIGRYLEQKGIPGVFLGQPVLWHSDMTSGQSRMLWFPLQTPKGPIRPSGAWLHNEIKKYNMAQSRVAEKFTNHNYLDLDSLIPKSAIYFFDDCHFTDFGSLTVASRAYESVITIIKKQWQLTQSM